MTLQTPNRRDWVDGSMAVPEQDQPKSGGLIGSRRSSSLIDGSKARLAPRLLDRLPQVASSA